MQENERRSNQWCQLIRLVSELPLFKHAGKEHCLINSFCSHTYMHKSLIVPLYLLKGTFTESRPDKCFMLKNTGSLENSVCISS